ncbi:hypothetical protein [Desulfocastanea catecholica]
MKNMYMLFCALLLAITPAAKLAAEDSAAAMVRIGGEVAALQLGLGGYVLGQVLTHEQKAVAREKPVANALEGTYKFQDGEVFVVVQTATDRIIGIYKENGAATREEVKKMVGDLMMQFKEPTTMAHDKLIYWAFDKDGRISEELFDQARQSGGKEVLATVKFSSSVPVFQGSEAENDEKKEAVKDEEPAAIYVIITSNPLSKIVVAQSK